jgi:hypothetical protein
MNHAATAIPATACTLLAVAMAAASATDRATGTTDRVLMIGTAVAFAVLAQVLPVLVRSAWRWPVWGAVMLVTLQGHVSLMTHAQQRAGADRAAAVATTATSQAITAELDSITARPLATVAAQVAAATTRAAAATSGVASCTARTGATPRTCAAAHLTATRATAQLDALRVELTQAERADHLRRQLATEATSLDSRRDQAAADPVTALIATATNASPATASALLAALTSSLLELCGVLLWREVRQQHAADSPTVHHDDQTTAFTANQPTPRHVSTTPPHTQASPQTPAGGPADRRLWTANTGAGAATAVRAAPADHVAAAAKQRQDHHRPAHPHRDAPTDERPGHPGGSGGPGAGGQRLVAAVRGRDRAGAHG